MLFVIVGMVTIL